MTIDTRSSTRNPSKRHPSHWDACARRAFGEEKAISAGSRSNQLLPQNPDFCAQQHPTLSHHSGASFFLKAPYGENAVCLGLWLFGFRLSLRGLGLEQAVVVGNGKCWKILKTRNRKHTIMLPEGSGEMLNHEPWAPTHQATFKPKSHAI